MGSRQKRGALALGIDFGATFIKMGLVDDRGKIRRRLSLEVRKDLSQTKLFEAICQAVHSLAKTEGIALKKVLGIGVGVPGLVDPEKGTIHFLTHVPGWRQIPLARQMRRRLGLPVFLDNDANLMALGEATYGAAKGCREVICLTLGTGVGGGILVNGSLYYGASFSSGEIGHMPVARNGSRCACGGRGCLELYVGNRAIASRARERLRRGESSLISKLVKGRLEKITPKTIDEAARRNDRLALTVWREVGEWLGIALAGLVNFFNPQRIVIGGGVARAGSYLFDPIRRTIRERALSWPVKHLKVVRAALGNDAGIIGASVLVRINMRERR